MKVHTQRIFILSFIFSQERIFKMSIGPTFGQFGSFLFNFWYLVHFGNSKILGRFLVLGPSWTVHVSRVEVFDPFWANFESDVYLRSAKGI